MTETPTPAPSGDGRRRRRANNAPGRDWVALTLAIGLCTSLNAVTLAVLVHALYSSDQTLSENATQLLIAGFGGITGILGTYVGFQVGRSTVARKPDDQV